MNLEEKTIKSEMIYQGQVVNLKKNTITLPDGRVTEREVIEHSGGVGVVALTEDNELIMVSQYRSGADKILLEIPAGKLNYGENPEECGRRELEEETGYKAKSFKRLASFYATPAYCAELLHIYLATDLYLGTKNTDDEEFLEVKKIPLSLLKDMVMDGRIEDAKTIVGILMAERMRR